MARTTSGRRWSQRVTETSDALDLEHEVFTKSDPRSIARSLQRSAEHSRRRKSDAYRSAMSMLTFYINRAERRCPKLGATSWRERRTNYAACTASLPIRRQTRRPDPYATTGRGRDQNPGGGSPPPRGG